MTAALAAFCLLIFLASLSVRDIESSAVVDVSLSGKRAEAYLQRLIASELSDNQVMEYLQSTIQHSGSVVNDDIGDLNLDAVKDALDIRIAKLDGSDAYRVKASYVGRGTACERFLVDQIANAMAERMNTGHSAGNTIQQINQQYSHLHQEMANNASARQVELSSALDLLEELNSSLSSLHEDVEGVLMDRPASAFAAGPGSSLDPEVRNRLTQSLDALRLGLQGLNAGELRLEYDQLNQAVSELGDSLGPLLSDDAILEAAPQRGDSPMRVVNASLRQGGPLHGVLSSIDEIDIDSIRSRVLQTQQNLRSDAHQLRNQIASLNTATKELSENRIVVDAIFPVRSGPTDSGPSPGVLLLFGVLAIAFGATVAFGYKPELDDVGYESADDAAGKLKLPLVSALHADSTNEMDDTKQNSVANSIVRFCEIGLTGFVLLAVVLCLTIPEIRSAFVENPFYGLSRIGDLFFGP